MMLVYVKFLYNRLFTVVSEKWSNIKEVGIKMLIWLC